MAAVTGQHGQLLPGLRGVEVDAQVGHAVGHGRHASDGETQRDVDVFDIAGVGAIDQGGGDVGWAALGREGAVEVADAGDALTGIGSPFDHPELSG